MLHITPFLYIQCKRINDIQVQKFEIIKFINLIHLKAIQNIEQGEDKHIIVFLVASKLITNQTDHYLKTKYFDHM